MTVYENKNYRVDYIDGIYKVVNQVTGAIEESHEILPKALVSAHMYHDAIERFHTSRQREANEANNVVDIRTPR